MANRGTRSGKESGVQVDRLGSADFSSSHKHATNEPPSSAKQDLHDAHDPSGAPSTPVGGEEVPRRGTAAGQLSRAWSALKEWRWTVLAAATAALVVGWAAANLAVARATFAFFSPAAAHGVEAASALARLFGALVLVLFLSGEGGRRLRWVAAGLVMLGLGGLVFGYAGPALLGTPADQEAAMYAGVLVRLLASVLLVAGLVPRRPPRFGKRSAVAVLVLFGAIVVAAEALEELTTLPSVTRVGDAQAVAVLGGAPLWPTGWEWALSLLPLFLSVAAVAGAAHLRARRMLPGWLVVAMVLFAGSQLHNVFWPSTYGTVLTSADILRLAFAATIAGGGIYELHRVARERAALLATERRRSDLLNELALMKADFTAMVAHELASPLLAVRGLSEMLATGELGRAERARILERLQGEVDRLDALIADVRASAAVERDDFAVEPCRVPVRALLDEVAAFAETLPGDHPLSVADETEGEEVWADPHRVGQVLRNLLSNAAKYSPKSAPVELPGACASRSPIRGPASIPTTCPGSSRSSAGAGKREPAGSQERVWASTCRGA